MIFPDHKKVASVIIARMGKDGGSEGDVAVKPEEQMDEELHGLHSAAEDMMSAMKEGSAHKYMSAMRSFIDQHHALVNEPLVETHQREKEERETDYEKSYPEA